MYYTERKPKNENAGGLGTRLLRIKALKCQTLVIVRHKPRLHVSCNLGMRQEPGSASLPCTTVAVRRGAGEKTRCASVPYHSG